MRAGFFLLGSASLGALLAMVVLGVENVRSGHGLDTYRTTWLVDFDGIAFLVLLAVTVVALSVAEFLRHLEWRQVKQRHLKVQRYTASTPGR